MNSKLNLLTKARSVFSHVIQTLYSMACVLLILGTVSVCYEVLMRYFLGRPQIWVVEGVSYSLLFITFLSGAWVLRREGHVRMDLLLGRLDPRNQALLNIVTSLLAAIVWFVISWYTAQLTWRLYLEGVRIESGLQPPKAPIIAIIPFGSFLLFVQLLIQAHGHLKTWRESRSKAGSSQD
jgi:C4-dicarboxylate transporter DctQ subunit